MFKSPRFAGASAGCEVICPLWWICPVLMSAPTSNYVDLRQAGHINSAASSDSHVVQTLCRIGVLNQQRYLGSFKLYLQTHFGHHGDLVLQFELSWPLLYLFDSLNLLNWYPSVSLFLSCLQRGTMMSRQFSFPCCFWFISLCQSCYIFLVAKYYLISYFRYQYQVIPSD